MNKQDRALVTETKALIKEVEAGDTAHAAWIAIQDRVQRLSEARTQADVGELLGKTKRWVGEVVRWNRTTSSSPYAGSNPPAKQDPRAAKRVLADPEQRKQVIAELDDETRVEIRQAIWDQEEEELKKNPILTPEQERSFKARTMEQEARKRTDRAYDNLRARQHYYGEIPVNDNERELLGWTIQVANYLLGNTELDAELEAMLNEG